MCKSCNVVKTISHDIPGKQKCLTACISLSFQILPDSPARWHIPQSMSPRHSSQYQLPEHFLSATPGTSTTLDCHQAAVLSVSYKEVHLCWSRFHQMGPL